ncbi:MAG: hypothetical protein ACI81T_004252 [Bacteroidia bacterium]|jgi:hypothetical protein
MVDIPFPVQAQLAELPEEAQRDFVIEYARRRKETPISYIAHFASLSEGYLDNWTLQIFFWLSFAVGIGPFWWFINLFRMPGKVKRFNQKMAQKVLKHIHFKYKIQGKSGLSSLKKGRLFASPKTYLKKSESPRPRIIKQIDPDGMSLESLKLGFMVDHRLETYEVVNDFQYDWDDSTSEKLYKLNEVGGVSNFFLMVQREGNTLGAFKVQPVNIYAIKEDLEKEIMEYKRPSNILRFQDDSFFREYSKTGWNFNLSQKNTAPQELVVWKYFNENRNRVIRIEKHSQNVFKAFAGEIVTPMDFPNIMPA